MGYELLKIVLNNADLSRFLVFLWLISDKHTPRKQKYICEIFNRSQEKNVFRYKLTKILLTEETCSIYNKQKFPCVKSQSNHFKTTQKVIGFTTFQNLIHFNTY